MAGPNAFIAATVYAAGVFPTCQSREIPNPPRQSIRTHRMNPPATSVLLLV